MSQMVADPIFLVSTAPQSEAPYGSGIPAFKAMPGKYRVFVTTCNRLSRLIRNNDDESLEGAQELASAYIEDSHATLSVAFIFNDQGQLVQHLFNREEAKRGIEIEALNYLVTKIQKLQTIVDVLRVVQGEVKKLRN